MLESKKKKKVFISAFVSVCFKGNANMQEPLETKPESASNPLQHKQPHPTPCTHTNTHTCTHHCSTPLLWKHAKNRTGVFLSAHVVAVHIHAHMRACTIPWPVIWLDPQRGCGSVTFTFRWRFSLSTVPCCYCCCNVGRHGWLPGPLIPTWGKLLHPSDSHARLSKCHLRRSAPLTFQQTT